MNKGDALLFYNVKPNGELNILSEHTGKPLESGQKMISNIWIRESEFTRQNYKNTIYYISMIQWKIDKIKNIIK